jgi:hypothetical protein
MVKRESDNKSMILDMILVQESGIEIEFSLQKVVKKDLQKGKILKMNFIILNRKNFNGRNGFISRHRRTNNIFRNGNEMMGLMGRRSRFCIGQRGIVDSQIHRQAIEHCQSEPHNYFYQFFHRAKVVKKEKSPHAKVGI